MLKKYSLNFSCTGSFVLAKLGLLNGKRCAVHPGHLKEMQDRFPEVIGDDQKDFIKTDIFYVSRGHYKFLSGF